MNASEVLKTLMNAGVLVEPDNQNLKVTASGQLSVDQIKLIKENKELLLTFFRKDSSTITASQEVVSDGRVSPEPQCKSQYYFEERQQNGEILRLTKEEFEQLSDFFKILIKMSRDQIRF